jgi:hypothetical protein
MMWEWFRMLSEKNGSVASPLWRRLVAVGLSGKRLNDCSFL